MDRAVEVVLWTVALVCVAITLAAGTRIVTWLVLGDSEGVWKAAAGLVLAASGGGYAAVLIRRNGKGSENGRR